MSNDEASAAGVSEPHLKKTLGPVMLWGMGVGYVISGEYFGWNLGLAAGGTFGLLAAFVLVTAMYIAFVFSYTEMACAIPRAGGVFVYGVRGLGLSAGYLGGIAQAIEFVFAPPAIAMAIGVYLSTYFPEGAAYLPKVLAISAYVVFTALNIWGVRQAAAFELGVTILAVGELALFLGVAAPHFEWSNFTANSLPHGAAGAFAAIPFAIWFYLAIEGVANAAEEARRPQRDVAIGFGSALATLVVLAAAVLFVGVGVGGWERIVYEPGDLTTAADGAVSIAEGAAMSDKPLPLALGQIVSTKHMLYHLLVGVGLLGLVASFNGIIYAASRALFEMGREGFLPHFVGRVNPRTKTPANSLLLNMALGVAAILLLDTGALITMSAMGAVTLYIVSMLAMLALRRREPDLPRPFRAPWYPATPVIALSIAVVCLLAMLYFNCNTEAESILPKWLSLWYLAALAVSYVYYFLAVRPNLTADDLARFRRVD